MAASRVLSWVAFTFLLVALSVAPVFFGAVHTMFASLVQALILLAFLAVLLRSLALAKAVVRDPLDIALLACWFYLSARYLSSSHEFQSRLSE